MQYEGREINILSYYDLLEANPDDLVDDYLFLNTMALSEKHMPVPMNAYFSDLHQFMFDHGYYLTRNFNHHIMSMVRTFVKRTNEGEVCVAVIHKRNDGTYTYDLYEEGFKFCSLCFNEITDEEESVTLRDGSLIHRNCVEENSYTLHQCDVCGGYFLSNEYQTEGSMRYLNDDGEEKDICCTCSSTYDFEHSYTFCNTHQRFERITIDHYLIPYQRGTHAYRSRSCMEGLNEYAKHSEIHVEFGECDACGREAWLSDEVTGGLVCYRCGEHYATTHAVPWYRGTHEHCFKPSPVFFNDDGTSGSLEKYGVAYFGIELELDNGDDEDSVEYAATTIHGMFGDKVYCKHDGSLDYGIECVTHPLSLKTAMEFPWKKLCDVAFNESCVYATSKGGLHIHVNRNYLGEIGYERNMNIAKLVTIWDMFWDELRVIGNRQLSQARRWADKSYAVFYEGDTEDELYEKLEELRYDSDRYKAVNLQNRNTIEFRLFASSDDEDKIKDLICVAAATVELAKTMSLSNIMSISWDAFSELLSEKKATMLEGVM